MLLKHTKRLNFIQWTSILSSRFFIGLVCSYKFRDLFMDNILLWKHREYIFINVLSNIIFWLSRCGNIPDDLCVKRDANLWKHFNEWYDLLVINISFPHLLGICNWTFILDNLIESYYIFIKVSFRIWRSLILNEGNNPIWLIAMYLLPIKLNLLSNRSYLASVEGSDALLH